MTRDDANASWPIVRPRAREIDPAKLLTLSLDILRQHEDNPIDPVEFEAAKTKQFRNSVWGRWHEFAKIMSFDPSQVWIDLCYRRDTAKSYCRTFLEVYVSTSTVRRPCLGPEEWHDVRTVNAAATVQDVWAALVKRADQQVLLPLRQGCNPMQAGIYDLGFSSRNNSSRSGPAYEVADWIPMLAEKIGLSLTQGFEKRELSDEDIVLILHTVWSRAEHIQCTPDVRLAFHAAVIIIGIGGFRSASVLGMKYKDVSFAWTRDIANPLKTNLVATITIHHVKLRKYKVQRDQRSQLKFSITFVPCRQVCLLTALATRALRDNAFKGGYTSIDQLLPEKPLDHDYVPLHWKSSVLDAKIVPCSYRSFWKVWNRTLYVAGLRNDDNIRPYALRVGAGGRLDGMDGPLKPRASQVWEANHSLSTGSLTRALSNYIMSHTTEVFERSYQARHLTANLMRIAFDSRAGDNDRMIRSLSSAFSRRDPDAPIYVSTDELAAFEERKDIQTLRQLHKETFKKEPHKATAIKNQIRYLLDCLEKLKLQEIRRKYFDTVDNLRGRHESTEHLDPQLTENPRSAREVPSFQRAVLSGKFMRENASVVTLGESLIAYLEERPTKLCPPVSKPPPPKSANVMDMRCLLCCVPFATVATLSRHVSTAHSFDEPFNCPECERNGVLVQVEQSCISWASHVKAYHKQFIAPSVAVSLKPAYCPLCAKCFTERGFSLHFRQAHKDKLSYPFACPECDREGIHDSMICSFDAWGFHVQNTHDGGDTAFGAIVGKRGIKRAASTADDNALGRKVRKESAKIPS
ncbi:uncharacterized protein BBA_09921 [Beauveria bassiana ARSEF 2860]|uniref:C2H2-type domain-containing protein n=1 Tax=Beauveria bassiana (strain ARSEF 2860) TaxID=655819 RepID=J5JAR9_BEAB2|nr:uncharacterized protein BBA_09921 [Beauveria bassiana ARSEF 2860]EJP61116.1 hypothetical protein BBA_09921 [Beauveria bassiana ARSEF 2860]